MAEAENTKVMRNHKKDATYYMANQKTEHHVKDLIHNQNSLINSKDFGVSKLIDIMPEKLISVKSSMSNLLKELYNNLNFYYSLTSPLHTSKNHTE